MDKIKMRGIGIRLGMGITFGLLSMLSGTMLLATMINREIVGQTSIDIGAGTILFVSASIAAMVSVGKGSNKLPVAVLTGAAYCLCLLCINALFFSGEYAGVEVSVLLAIGASACVGVLASGKKNKGKYKHKKK